MAKGSRLNDRIDSLLVILKTMRLFIEFDKV
jgi:hypothetical protein